TEGALPESIVRFVMRTHESVILDDAAAGSTDPYVQRTGVRSVLCLPLVKQGQLAGVIYLENRRTAYAFTPRSVGLLQLLAGQAAISLENARLVVHLRRAAEADALARANERLELALRGSKVGIWDVDARRGTLEAVTIYSANVWEPLGY